MLSLARPIFPDDDGSADPRLGTALATYEQSRELPAVLQALPGVRLLVPVVAVRGDDMAPAPGDKGDDMAAVLLTGADGRTALLAFSDLRSLLAWKADARPVPVLTQQVAAAAKAEGATAIVLDVAGPVAVVVEESDLLHLAAGDTLVRTRAGLAWARQGA